MGSTLDNKKSSFLFWASGVQGARGPSQEANLVKALQVRVFKESAPNFKLSPYTGVSKNVPKDFWLVDPGASEKGRGPRHFSRN